MMTQAAGERPMPAGIRIANAQAEHGAGVAACVRAAYGVAPDETGEWCITAGDLWQQLARFAEGQFVALQGEEVVGYASTMRVSRPPRSAAVEMDRMPSATWASPRTKRLASGCMASR